MGNMKQFERHCSALQACAQQGKARPSIFVIEKNETSFCPDLWLLVPLWTLESNMYDHAQSIRNHEEKLFTTFCLFSKAIFCTHKMVDRI